MSQNDPARTDASATPPSPSPVASPRLGQRWLVLPLVLALGTASLYFATRGGESSDVRGVRLGFSAADARDRFQTAGPGTWTSAAEPEPVLRWVASDEHAPLRAATLEFHNGMLVAVRLSVAKDAPEAAGDAMVLSRTSVTSRKQQPDQTVSYTVLSRDCPTHAEEVRKLIAGEP